MNEVDRWLTSIGLTQYTALFAVNDIDLDLVREMSEADFEMISVASFGRRRRLVRAAANLADAATPRRSREGLGGRAAQCLLPGRRLAEAAPMSESVD